MVSLEMGKEGGGMKRGVARDSEEGVEGKIGKGIRVIEGEESFEAKGKLVS